MKYMGFQIVFNILNVKTTLQTDWPNTFSTTTWQKRFWRNVFGRITKVTMVHYLTPPKKHILMDQIFFQNPYCWFIIEQFWTSLTNQQSFPEILVICYFRALWACQACLTTPKKNFMIKLQLRWISYYMQKENFLPQIVFEILEF